jgi:MoxR-like ATPase
MNRIQFTPDLLPADVLGTQIFDPKTSEFRIKKGPVFANLLIADEINRAPAKVQSALLQAMQERQVTLGDETFNLPDPFLVMATQNPIEQEGTYQLPEAQIDRFLFKVNVTYTTRDEEEQMVARMVAGEEIPLERVLAGEDIRKMREFCKLIHVSDKIRRYIINLVFATREPEESGFGDLARLIEYGASPRASIFLEQAARVNAMLEGRAFVTPQDVKDVGLHVLRHRVVLTYEAEADKISSDQIVKRIFEGVDVP